MTREPAPLKRHTPIGYGKWIAVALLAASLLACRKTNGTPFGTVEAALGEARKGRYAEAAEFMVTEFEAFGRRVTRKDFAKAAFWRQYTQNRTIGTLQLQEVKPLQDGMTSVSVVIHYTDGKTMQASFVLLREGSEWRITPVIETKKNWR